MSSTKLIPKFKIGDIVTIKPYSGNSNSIHNINLSRRPYEEVRLKGKAVITKTYYNKYNNYGTVYYLENSEWTFHETCLIKVNQKIRY